MVIWIPELCHLSGIQELTFTMVVFHPYISNFLLQWLVKRAIETKEEMGDYIRSYSISQFQKTYSLPEVSFLLFLSVETMSAYLEPPWEEAQ